VREPPVLRGQARLDGSADHRLRPPSRGRERAGASLRPAAHEPGHPRRDGDADRRAVCERPLCDRDRHRDRPRLRAHRRPSSRRRRADRARRGVDPRRQHAAQYAPRMSEQAAAGVRVNVYGRGEATVETGLPVLNRLVTRLAETARFDIVLDIEPGDTEKEVEAAAAALGHALAGPLRADGARGHGAGALISAEALASVVLETSDEPLFVTNVDLTQARIGGLGTDVTRRFLERLAEHAGLRLRVPLL